MQAYTVLPGLSANLFEKIYDGSFELSNLYKFRINNGYTDDTQSQIVTMENGIFRLDAVKKKTRISVILLISGRKDLSVLNEFHLRILELARYYK